MMAVHPVAQKVRDLTREHVHRNARRVAAHHRVRKQRSQEAEAQHVHHQLEHSHQQRERGVHGHQHLQSRVLLTAVQVVTGLWWLARVWQCLGRAGDEGCAGAPWVRLCARPKNYLGLRWFVHYWPDIHERMREDPQGCRTGYNTCCRLNTCDSIIRTRNFENLQYSRFFSLPFDG